MALLDLEPGEYALRAGPGPSDDAARVIASRVRIAADECSEADLDLQSVLLEGHVTRPEASSGVLRAVATSMETGEQHWSKELVDADGLYPLRLPHEGEYLLCFQVDEGRLRYASVTFPPGTATLKMDFEIGEQSGLEPCK